MAQVIITGAGGGGAPNRLEIHDFVKQEQQFSLYIQALQLMYTNKDQSYIQSFFQIAGIHGLPYIPWDGSTGNPPFDPNAQWGGYCTHGSVLFPTWHRPYVLLYEQTLWQRAQEVAAKYTVNTASWKAAALTLRQPYWDWARNSTPPDEVIALKQVTITKFNGTKGLVDNPLYHYRFHPIDPSFPDPYSGWQTTLRQPTSTDPTATDNIPRLRSILRSVQSNITSNIYSMLTRVHTWPAFSNHTVGDGGSTSNSLEAIHDGIHVYVGGQGQMADPSVAGFDPIFFLHHANVDRMLSLWSALNPGVWVSKGDSEDGTFTMPAEVPVDKNTDLTPFWNAQTTFWESAGVTDTSKLGYTYPEFNGLNMGNPSAVKAAIAAKVNTLYGRFIFGLLSAAPTTSLASVAASTAQKVDTASAAAPQQAAFVAQAIAPTGHHVTAHDNEPRPTVHVSPSSHPEGNLWDWTARVEFKKYELGTSFSVILFLGHVPENPNDWLVSPNFVGAHHAFVNSTPGHCANCHSQSELIEEGFIHLNHGIATHSGLNSLEPNVVEPYLIQNLHWRVQKVDESQANLESLEVAVFATPLSFPPGSDFPQPSGDPHRHNRITHGRRGGSRHA